MSLNISKDEVNNYLSNKVSIMDISSLNKEFHILEDINKKFINYLSRGDISGYEYVTSDTNPLLWELGHICYFYEVHTFDYLLDNYDFYYKDILFDSFQVSKQQRYKYKFEKDYIIQYYQYIQDLYSKKIQDSYSCKDFYILMLSLLHNHMHCESFIYTLKNLQEKSFFYTSVIFTHKIPEIKWIKINEGELDQGSDEGDYLFTWDNEKPKFKTIVKSFYISDITLTEYHVMKFILDGGYQNQKWWSFAGNEWRMENHIELPMYWIKVQNNFRIKTYNSIRDISYDLPACHISYYEAEALAKYYNARLPMESEWEYIATNCNKNKYPWGDLWVDYIANVNYSGEVCSVNKHTQVNQIKNLIGNVWEWCQEGIYPYNGFTMDPIYREFSYPFFGYKKILKGGAWCVPSVLINPKYRNAQTPDTRIQFTGVRLIKDP